jgi:hypothetical protein
MAIVVRLRGLDEPLIRNEALGGRGRSGRANMDQRDVGDSPGEPIERRPRDLALLLLAIEGGPPRQRARDQQADMAGLELHRRVLDRLACLDPEPEECEASLARIVAEFGEPTGPTRGVCLRVKQEWEEARDSPLAWSWLLSEALEAGDGAPRRRRRRGPESAP